MADGRQDGGLRADSGRFSLVLSMFSCLSLAMPLLLPLPEPVTFEEVAAILDEAVMQTSGGPPCVIGAAGWHLAAALSAAGFYVFRAPADDRQLTL